MAAATIPRNEVRETKAAQPYVKDAVTQVNLITNTGLDILSGKDAYDLAEKIRNDTKHSPLDYRFFDDDKRTWAYWAVLEVDGKTIKPLTFPGLEQYSLTSPQLYTKAVTYPRILAHAVGLLKEKPQTLWDRMMKPTTIITAIVLIVLVMGIMLMALQG